MGLTAASGASLVLVPYLRCCVVEVVSHRPGANKRQRSSKLHLQKDAAAAAGVWARQDSQCVTPTSDSSFSRDSDHLQHKTGRVSLSSLNISLLDEIQCLTLLLLCCLTSLTASLGLQIWFARLAAGIVSGNIGSHLATLSCWEYFYAVVRISGRVVLFVSCGIDSPSTVTPT